MPSVAPDLRRFGRKKTVRYELHFVGGERDTGCGRGNYQFRRALAGRADRVMDPAGLRRTREGGRPLLIGPDKRRLGLFSVESCFQDERTAQIWIEQLHAELHAFARNVGDQVFYQNIGLSVPVEIGPLRVSCPTVG